MPKDLLPEEWEELVKRSQLSDITKPLSEDDYRLFIRFSQV